MAPNTWLAPIYIICSHYTGSSASPRQPHRQSTSSAFLFCQLMTHTQTHTHTRTQVLNLANMRHKQELLFDWQKLPLWQNWKTNWCWGNDLTMCHMHDIQIIQHSQNILLSSLVESTSLSAAREAKPEDNTQTTAEDTRVGHHHSKHCDFQRRTLLPGGELATKMICISNLAADNRLRVIDRFIKHNCYYILSSSGKHPETQLQN